MARKMRKGGVLALAAMFLAGCGWVQSAPPAGVAARVNGYDITDVELARALAEQTGGDSQPIPSEQLERLRLGLLSQLIDREVALQYAAHLGIVPQPDDVTRQIAIEKIKRPDLSEEELRRRAREELILQQLFAREVTAKIQVTDAAIDDYYDHNRSLFNVAEPRYHVQEILVTARPAPVANLTHDKAGNAQQARDKLKMLEAQLKQGADFGTLAQQYSEDPDTAPSGGDMGLITESALDTQVPPALRQAIMLLAPGQVSAPIVTSNGTYLLKLVEKQSPGQHPASDPQVRATIREVLTNQRATVLRAALIAVLRNKASVHNYLAEELLEENGVGGAAGR